ncbi:hypothetical protein CAPTEDRAFT_141560, partial [Capitella teleta]
SIFSGGKDSCYNMMQCVSEGHEIVALANLRPKDPDKNEIDSYMFQTVGHQAIDLYAEAMGLPLFRQTIEGSSVELGMYYTETEADEVEDLYKLLSRVKEECPIEAVSVGAILSDYQRVRVENVCQRLGLTSLAYLWRREQDELLDEMIAAQVKSIIVKVAAMGLNPDEHLGLTLSQIQPHMREMNEKYGLNICGEGGEFETFTLDCPLFKMKIIVDDKEILMHSDDPFAPVAYLQLKEMHLEEKEDEYASMLAMVQDIPMMRSSDLLGQIFPDEEDVPTINNPPVVEDVERPVLKKLKISSSGMLYLSGFTAAVNKEDEGDLTKHTEKVMKSMKGAVEKAGFSMRDIVFVHLCVRDMSQFALVNQVYKTFFSNNPPIRVCIETCLPSNVNLTLSCGVRQCSERKTMHVQGLSHWAPANIGPYSQAVKLDEFIFVAGQIPLVPASMQVVSDGVLPQARLSLRHTDRVLQAIAPQSNGIASVILAVCYITHKDFVSVAEAEWKKLIASKDECFGQVEYVVITSLPRNCLVEWDVYGALTVSESNTKHCTCEYVNQLISSIFFFYFFSR